MPITEFDIRKFTTIEMPKPESCSHEITTGYFEDEADVWYCKEALDETRARHEILGQEFYRLLLPYHPEMRLAKDFETGQWFTLSKAVIGFQPIPIQKKLRLTSGVYTGLGQILVLAIFLHEIDLNMGNLGLNQHNKFIKIDGDWSFSSLVRPDLLVGKSSDITPELFDSLPYLTNYEAHNWLDILNKGEPTSSDVFSDDLIDAPHFRLEINAAILQIILLPDSYIRRFAEFYLPGNYESLNSFLLEKKEKLKQSAVENESFIRFLSSPDAEDVMRFHLSTIKNYAPRNPSSLFVSIDDVDFEQDCWSVLCSLRSEIKKIPRTAICTSVPEEDEMFCDIGTDAESFSSQPSFSTVDRYGMFRIRSASSESSRSSSGSLMRFNRTFSDLSSMGSAK